MELYHYGVKGMKWGVRKSKAERLKDWKNKQHSRLDAQTGKDQSRFDKRIARVKNAINNGPDVKKEARLKTLEGKKRASKALNDLGHKQIDAINQKDYDELVKNQVYLTGASIASIALASTGNLPFAYFHVPSTDLDFRDYRLKHSDTNFCESIGR